MPPVRYPSLTQLFRTNAQVGCPLRLKTPPASPPRYMNAATVLRLREELEDSQARVDAALNDLGESQACVLGKTREMASLRREGDELLAQVEELEGDSPWVSRGRINSIWYRVVIRGRWAGRQRLVNTSCNKYPVVEYRGSMMVAPVTNQPTVFAYPAGSVRFGNRPNSTTSRMKRCLDTAQLCVGSAAVEARLSATATTTAPRRRENQNRSPT